MHRTTYTVSLGILLALALVVGTTSPLAAATANSSDVNLEITYSFAGAEFTDSGLPAEYGFDYEFDGSGEPSHFFDGFGTFIYSEGDGTGSIAGTANVGSHVHTYPDFPPDFIPFDPNTEDVTLLLSSSGQSSTPGSNGSAAIESGLSLYITNFTYDPNTDDTVSLTFYFDYDYTFSMTLVEDAPAGGEGNGFIEIDAELIEDDTTLYPDLVTEFYGGPANLFDVMGSGQIVFVTTPGQYYAELFIRTNVNSTTLVPEIVPEPASALLLTLGCALAAFVPRHRRRT